MGRGLVAKQAAVAQVVVFKGFTITVLLAVAGVGAALAKAGVAKVAGGTGIPVIARSILRREQQLALAGRRYAGVLLACGVIDAWAADHAGRVDLAGEGGSRGLFAVERAVAVVAVFELVAVAVVFCTDRC